MRSALFTANLARSALGEGSVGGDASGPTPGITPCVSPTKLSVTPSVRFGTKRLTSAITTEIAPGGARLSALSLVRDAHGAADTWAGAGVPADSDAMPADVGRASMLGGLGCSASTRPVGRESDLPVAVRIADTEAFV